MSPQLVLLATSRARRLRLLAALAATLLAAACASLPTPTGDPSAGAPVAQAEAPAAQPEPSPPLPAMPEPASFSVAPDLWERFARSRHWQPCEATPAVQRWIGLYARKPERFANTLTPVLPLMDYVLTQAEAHGLPGEVMLVPIIESSYRVDARGPAGALGMWQLMPATGQRFGLAGRHGDDGRLDVHAATDAALRLLRLNADAFSDNPKLMFAAYNAGAYRLRKALGGRDHASMRSLEGLGLSRTTREYIDKLKALGCLIGEPERFDLHLPPLTPGARLVEYRPPFAIDPNAVAARAGASAADVKAWNRRAFSRSAADPGTPMLLPGSMLEALQAALAAGEVPRAVPRRAAAAPSVAAARGRVHKVASGDSLWTISKRYRVRLSDLMRWNGLNQQSVLRIGQTLIVQGNS